MLEYEKHKLSNGLRVLVHRDETTPMAAVNMLYDVGARDEDPERTGFAHLFEHLMFEGSVNVSRFDYQLQHAGGENNAFTTNDITNYYNTLPARNLETAFWLESDRMLGLAFSEEKLITQKNVVTEEYRQSYLNQPYGDAWLLMRPLAYREHPYRWATIGKNIEHIQNASLLEVRKFFTTFYHPANAILSVAGHVDPQKVFVLAEKWFGGIFPGNGYLRQLPAEPSQNEERKMMVERDVPQHQIYMAFHVCGRSHPDFHATDLLSDILSNGESARLPARLVHYRKAFSEINAYVTGNLDPGLLVISGMPHNEVNEQEAEDMLWQQAQELVAEPVTKRELQKVKNRVEATHTFAQSHVLSKAMNLAYYELQGDADRYNRQMDAYLGVTADDLQRIANRTFKRGNASILHYGRPARP